MDCISEESQEEKDNEVYSIGDAVRSACRVYIVLQNGTASEKRTFAPRMWTLPEVLLWAGGTRFWIPSTLTVGDFEPQDTSLIDMYGS